MKSEKGITLTSLVVYIIVATFVVGCMAIVSGHFFKNVNLVKGQSTHVVEYNKFNMFFIKDIKENTTATVTSRTIIFEDETKYEYKNNAIYRNNTKIAENVLNANFTSSTYTIKNTKKNLIHVNLTIGNQNNQYQKQIEYVLKYW